MRKLIFILQAAVCFCLVSRAQNTGIYEAGIIVGGNTYTEPSNSLNGKVIVKAKGQRLELTSAFVKTFKNISASNVCGGYMFYRIYPINSVPTAFNELDCELFSNINGGRPGFQNQLWQNNSINLNLAANLDTGSYVFEVYYAADASANYSSCNGFPTLTMKNGTEYFKATIVITAPLDAQFSSFFLRTNNEIVFIDWSIEQVTNDLQYFILEKSKNGVVWHVLDTVGVNGTTYLYIDETPYLGVNFYRIRAKGQGKNNYSIDRRIYVGHVENIVTIYPNPVHRNLRFRMTAVIKGKYDVVVYNSDGSRVSAQTISHDGNDNYVTIPLPVNLAKGVYWLVLYNSTEFYKRSFTIE